MRMSCFASLVFVALAAPAAAQGALPTSTLREEWRLNTGAVDLIQIQGLTVTADGGIIVVAGQDRQVHRFEPDGRLRFSAGREGRGPGEFTAPNTARPTGDSLWVHDLLARRLTVFGPTGRYVRSVELAGTRTISAVGGPFAGRRVSGLIPDFVAADGDVVGWTSVIANGPNDASTSLLVRLGRDSTLRLIADGIAEVRSAVDWRNAEGTSGSIMVPFAPRQLRGVSADGRRIVVAVTEPRDRGRSDLRVRVVDARSAAVTEHRASFAAIPVTRARRDSAMEAQRRIGAGPGIGGVVRRGPPPETYAAIEARIPATADLIPGGRQLLVAPDGTMYVPLLTADHPTPRYAVFAPDGRQTAWITPPPKVFLRAATATHLWGIVTDDDGFPQVVRFAIVR
jgi:hypothetical protein